jgi:uncharacterized protein (UPF0276 family)
MPPIETPDALASRVRALKASLGRPLGLENICLSTDDAGFCSRYHQTFIHICREEGLSILLDVENLRLDSIGSGIPMPELLGYYEYSTIIGYHVAGSRAGEMILDTHDQPVSDITLQLLLQSYKNKPAPVIYEREYALDIVEIQDEVNRITDWLKRQVLLTGSDHYV